MSREHRASSEDGFLIGSLVGIIEAELGQRVLAGYQAAGFTDIRAIHSAVFRLLPSDGCRVTELAALAHMSKQAMGYLVDYLEQHGYVERVPDPTDGRAQIVRRTARGWALNRAARQIVQDTQDTWARQLGEERMVALIESLRLLVQMLGVAYAGSISEVSVRADRS